MMVMICDDLFPLGDTGLPGSSRGKTISQFSYSEITMLKKKLTYLF